MNRLGPGLEIWQPHAFPGNVHVLPPQRHDLAEATAGRDEQASGGDLRELSGQPMAGG